MNTTFTTFFNMFFLDASGRDFFSLYQARSLDKTDNQVPTDEAVARQIRSGRIDQIDLLVNRYSDRLFRIILRLIQSQGAAEDILQETWIKVMRKIHQYDPSRPFSSWLTRIAVNSCRDYWRKERRRRIWKKSSMSNRNSDPESQETFTHDDFEMRENHVMVLRALMNISNKLREVVVLKF